MKRAFAALVVGLLCASPVAAQFTALDAGARVRVTSPQDGLKREIATVVGVRGDSLAVTGRSGSRTIAFSNVTSLEVSRGRRSMFMRDTALGFGVGALAGAVIGVVSYEECTECWFGPSSVSESAMMGGAVLGAMGLVAGALVGVFDRAERWERRVPGIKASVGPSRSGGVNLGLSRAF